MFKNIQMLRAVAATAVVLCHTTHLWTFGPPVAANFLVSLGFAGVDLFFVISGFIIAMVADRSSREQRSSISISWAFAWRRIIRIYPIFWVVFLSASVSENYLPEMAANNPGASVVASFFLLTLANSAVPAAWTLPFELLFYALISGLLLVNPTRFRVNLALLAVIHSVVIVVYSVLALPTPFLFSPLVLDFYFGCGLFLFVRRGTVSYPLAFIAVGAISLGFGSYFNWMVYQYSFAMRPYLLGVPSVLLLAGMIGLEKTWRSPATLTELGDASYSLYLWHNLLISALTAYWVSTPLLATEPLLRMALTTGFAVVFSLASYRYIESPMTRKLQSITVRTNPMRPEPQCTST